MSKFWVVDRFLAVGKLGRQIFQLRQGHLAQHDGQAQILQLVEKTVGTPPRPFAALGGVVDLLRRQQGVQPLDRGGTGGRRRRLPLILITVLAFGRFCFKLRISFV